MSASPPASGREGCPRSFEKGSSMTYFPTTSFSNPSSFSKPPVQHQLVSARMEVQGLSPVTADGSLVLDKDFADIRVRLDADCLLYTSPSPRDRG